MSVAIVRILDAYHELTRECLMPLTECTSMDSIRSGHVMLDFYSTTCGPCRAMHPVLEELARENKDLNILKVDVTRCPDMTQQFGVTSLPTVVFLVDSQVQEVAQGFPGKDALKMMVKRNLHGRA